MSAALQLALVQVAPVATDPSARHSAALKSVEQRCQEAHAAGADLIVFPEAWLSGYDQPYQSMTAVAEPGDGPLAHSIAEIAQRHDLAIAYGYVERDGSQYYNAVQVLSSEGVSLARYRKTHLWGGLDKTLFSAGDVLGEPFELQGWKLGLLICYDVEFPETVRTLALKGAEILLVPTALMSPWAFVAESLVPVRAAESQVFIAYANQCGQEASTHYVGLSCITGPSGELLAQAGTTPALLHARLHRHSLETARSQLPYLSDRRPELYLDAYASRTLPTP